MRREKQVWVIGHKNPDTDSICAAIAYADLKNKTENVHFVAKRAGNINEETRYVLDQFEMEEPELVTDVGAQIKDISFRQTAGVSEHISLKRAWELMKTENVVTLPVTGPNHKVKGLIVTSDIATSYMDVYDNHILSIAKTQYKNILETIQGNILTGNEHAYFVKGKVVVSTGPDWMEMHVERDDLVILGDALESQMKAIELNASCIVVCCGFDVSKEVLEAAKKRDCVVIGTPYETFTVARLINQSMPIKYFMTKDGIISFDLEDYVDDVKEIMSKVRHRDFPVLDEEGDYAGMISRRNLLNMQKKQVILVDHNEKSQAVDGIDGAEILEIIDHHRLGSLETISPVFFRNQPLGCTSTIIYQIYQEKDVEIPEKIAGLLLAAILSDTLMFRSPTCTSLDRTAAEELANIAGIDIENLAKNMFRAGSDFNRKTPEEIFYQDFKKFTAGEYNFGVAQLSAMSREELESVRERLKDYIDTALNQNGLDMIFVMLTDIIEESTMLLTAGEGAEAIIGKAFSASIEEEGYLLKGVVSRKKQLIPSLMAVMQE
ncbi:MAG: putative manganese-dependent inorganic diphosphatase [Roseburia sp.]|nr:putative manganese-dependent inorganic diphosphatase [Roseburia sp.]